MKKITILFLIIFSCSSENELNNVDYYNIEPRLNYTKNIKNIVSDIKIDTLKLDSDIESSFEGFFYELNDTIYFADVLFNYVFRFTSNGILIDKKLGKGFQKNEIKGFNANIVIDNNHFFINELTSEITGLDAEFKKLFEYKIDWQIDRSKKEALNNPSPIIGDTYEFDFGVPENFKYWDDEHFAIAITTSHPNFNGYFNSKDYYAKSRIIALVNNESGQVVELVGRRSPELLKYNYLPNFDHFNYENVGNSIYVNFWCDTIIYEIDKKSKIPIDKFGFAGSDMKMDYIETSDYPTAKNRWRIDQTNFGYYNYLKYVKEKNILFRGYRKGKDRKFSGLQIYKNKNLVGDINVPIGLKIIGILNDTIIAYNADKNESFELYKINLTYEK